MRVAIIIPLFIIAQIPVYSQLTVRHLRTEPASKNNQRVLQSQQNFGTLQIPFWDDFSQSLGQPHAGIWENSENVNINPTLGSNPPTLNVATFDGTDAFGVPYDIKSQFVGNTDNLTSRAIDLSKIPGNKLNTVFISFFWQARGNGEVPNDNDSLRLQFLTTDSLWVTQFKVIGGESSLRTDQDDNDVFSQEILKVDGQEFFHDKFRFRFQSFGRLTGGFDTWHIDYVFLNQDRDFADLAYFDRGITKPPSSLLGEFSAIPADQFFESPSQFVKRLQFELFNLDALPHPVEFTLNVYDVVNNILIDKTNEPTTTPILFGLERRVVETNLPDLNGLPFSDSLVLETEIIYNTGDRNLIQFVNPVSGDTAFYDNVDYKVNDTLRRTFNIQNYLAYDDGTAEFAAGINQIRGQLAYRYVVPTRDTLTDIDIYFPRIAPSVDGLPIEIYVWKNLLGITRSLIAKQSYTIQHQEGLNQFTRYTFEIPEIVKDTIYIGWEQFSDNFVGVGLDKNNDTVDKIFVNVDGAWKETVGIEGSLMLRPVFRQARTKVVAAVNSGIPSNISIYPNPNNGIFTIDGQFDSVEIFDLTGKKVPFEILPGQITIDSNRSGIYLAKILKNNQSFIERVILK